MEKLTITAYDQRFREYDAETTQFWNKFPENTFNRFIYCLSSGPVLNIGSGPGKDSEILRRMGKETICLDASFPMTQLTKGKNFESIQGDFLKLPFKNSSFAGAWAFTSLLHVEKKLFPKALKEIKRVLKPEGCLTLGMIEGESEGYRKSSGVDLDRYFAEYNLEEILDHLKLEDFSVVYFNPFKPNKRTYWSILARK